MNAVIYCSYSGQSKRIAEYIAEQTHFTSIDICELSSFEYETVYLVFPVHCQSLPQAVKQLLARLSVEHLIPVATYGRMWHGNVLFEIQRHYKHNIVAAAYVPTKHAYLPNDGEFDRFDELKPVFAALDDPKRVNLPKEHKNPLSGVFPRLRGRIGIKLYKVDGLCDGCGLCRAVCTVGAMNDLKPNRRCIRCLKCVHACPNNALRFKPRSPMRLYLKKNKHDELKIYLPNVKPRA